MRFLINQLILEISKDLCLTIKNLELRLFSKKTSIKLLNTSPMLLMKIPKTTLFTLTDLLVISIKMITNKLSWMEKSVSKWNLTGEKATKEKLWLSKAKETMRKQLKYLRRDWNMIQIMLKSNKVFNSVMMLWNNQMTLWQECLDRKPWQS